MNDRRPPDATLVSPEALVRLDALRELEMPLGRSLVEAWTIGDAMGLLRYSRS